MRGHRNMRALAAKLNPVYVLCAAALAVILFFTLRDYGAQPTTMWDEWEYNRYARQLPLAAADVPYYLFYFIYGATKICGAGFLGCAHFFNALCFAASLPFLYLACRRTAPQNLSLAVAIASVLGGVSVYTAHFMPEPIYFLGFWIGVWALLTAIDRRVSVWALGIGAGCFAGVLSLLKLHAVFLLPGIILFFFFCAIFDVIKGGMRKFAILAVLTVVFFAVMRFGLGYAFAGAAGLSLFGPTYAGRAQSAASSAVALVDLLGRALPFLLGHLLAVLSFFAVPVLLMFKNPEDKKLLALQSLTFALLMPLLAVVALYTAHVAQLDPIVEGANGHLRLHLRYYDFMLPLFVMIAASVATRPALPMPLARRKIAIAVFVAAAVIWFVCDLPHYRLSISDSPELRAFATLPVVTYLLAAAALFGVAVWVWNEKSAAIAWLILFFPFFTLMGQAAAIISAHKAKTPTVYQLAGSFARDHLGADVAKIAVIGPEMTGVYEAMFAADNPAIAIYDTFSERSCLDFTPAPNGKEWMLVIGDYQVPPVSPLAATGEGYRLFHVMPSVVAGYACK